MLFLFLRMIFFIKFEEHNVVLNKYVQIQFMIGNERCLHAILFFVIVWEFGSNRVSPELFVKIQFVFLRSISTNSLNTCSVYSQYLLKFH